MKKTILLTTIIGALFGALTWAMIGLGATALAAETWYVGADALNLRAEPNTDCEVLTVYPHGAELSVIGINDSGAWWEVYDGTYQGWVSKTYMVNTPEKYALGEYIGIFWVTGYTPDPSENAGYTTTCLGDDLWSNVGNIVAVDKSVIPLNRTIYIEGIGYRRTRDTGVRGRVIDVLTGSNAESSAITANRKVWLVE